MTNKQLFIQKLAILLREKNNRINLVLIGQEALEIFSGSERKAHKDLSDSIIIQDMNRRIIDYAQNPKDEKAFAGHLTNMSELILD